MFTPNSRIILTNEDADKAHKMLKEYHEAKLAEREAKKIADERREALIRMVGDAEYADDADGAPVFRAAEQTRETLPAKVALDRHPDLADVLRTTRFRMIGR